MGEAPGQTNTDPHSRAIAIYVDAPGGVSVAAGDHRRCGRIRRPRDTGILHGADSERAHPTGLSGKGPTVKALSEEFPNVVG
jgi:hypothetical protein